MSRTIRRKGEMKNKHHQFWQPLHFYTYERDEGNEHEWSCYRQKDIEGKALKKVINWYHGDTFKTKVSNAKHYRKRYERTYRQTVNLELHKWVRNPDHKIIDHKVEDMDWWINW